MTFENDGFAVAVVVSLAKVPSIAGRLEWTMSSSVGSAAVDRLTKVATCAGKDCDVVIAVVTAAYHSWNSHCGCETVAEEQGCYLRG